MLSYNVSSCDSSRCTYESIALFHAICACNLWFAYFDLQVGKAASTVDRLTDVSKYTGSHKQRFDETGKGKGIAGRKDIPDTSGYVQGYQNKDTYKGQ